DGRQSRARARTTNSHAAKCFSTTHVERHGALRSTENKKHWKSPAERSAEWDSAVSPDWPSAENPRGKRVTHGPRSIPEMLSEEPHRLHSLPGKIFCNFRTFFPLQEQ